MCFLCGIIYILGFKTLSFPFCTVPKTEQLAMKTLHFFLSNFDQTLKYLEVSSTKSHLVVGKLWLSGLFSRGKGDNIDMWMIKIMIKAKYVKVKLIWMFCLFRSESLFLKSSFFHYFIGLSILSNIYMTYSPLESICLKATSHVIIFMCGPHARSQIQRNNYNHGNGRPNHL